MDIKLLDPMGECFGFDSEKEKQEFLEKKKKFWEILLDKASKKNNEVDEDDILKAADEVGIKKIEDALSEYCCCVDYDVDYADLEKSYENRSYVDDNLIEGYRVSFEWCHSPYCSLFESTFTVKFIKRDLEAEAKEKADWIAAQKTKFDGDFEKFAAEMYDSYIKDKE